MIHTELPGNTHAGGLGRKPQRTHSRPVWNYAGNQ